MRYHDFDFRHQIAQRAGDAVQILDMRTDIERLPAAIMFAHDSLADNKRIIRQNKGANRQPIQRRCCNQTEFAHTCQRQLQRPRNRRRGQSQHMHFRAQIFQTFFLFDSKMLFFIDNH